VIVTAKSPKAIDRERRRQPDEGSQPARPRQQQVARAKKPKAHVEELVAAVQLLILDMHRALRQVSSAGGRRDVKNRDLVDAAQRRFRKFCDDHGIELEWSER
jgi:hypothetical protein